MLKLESIAAFSAIAEAGSITGAARRLGLSKSVVSERLTELERVMGTTLVRRTTRSLSLTDDGKTFHERLENHAIELSFRAGRDNFHGSLRALTEHREEAFDLLRLALTAPRFEADVLCLGPGAHHGDIDISSPNQRARRVSAV